jgi:alpha-tubulin suppressor-like RCC1 family protein
MIDLGLDFGCAWKGSAVRCWGANSYGQLGDGTEDPHLQPQQVLRMNESIRGISTGESHACAIKGPSVRCWGYNGSGQLGDGTEDQRERPVRVLL